MQESFHLADDVSILWVFCHLYMKTLFDTVGAISFVLCGTLCNNGGTTIIMQLIVRIWLFKMWSVEKIAKYVVYVHMHIQ